MKVRWTENSVRARITPTELEELQNGQTVHEIFPLGWHAAIVPAAPVTALQQKNGVVQIELTAADMEALSIDSNEGIYFQTKDKVSVRYFIEKDFPCAHPRPAEAMEPQTETFTPPVGFKERHT